MFIQRNNGVVRIVREPQYVLPTTQPLLTVLGTSREALHSLGISNDSVLRLYPDENVAPLFRFSALVYPETIIGHLGSWESARTLPVLDYSLTKRPLAYRWTAWVEQDWDEERQAVLDKVCVTGVCKLDELESVSKRFASSSDTFLVYPVFTEHALKEPSIFFLDDSYDDLLEAIAE